MPADTVFKIAAPMPGSRYIYRICAQSQSPVLCIPTFAASFSACDKNKHVINGKWKVENGKFEILYSSQGK
jgi:hypothetical protein